MNIQKTPVIFLYGPTAVGKTAFAEKLAEQIPAELVNMDSAQCYTPLTIGTAKPDWRACPTTYHLFDIEDQPRNFSVTDYRERALTIIDNIRKKGKTPIFVGGSGFYLLSLLYPPMGAPSTDSTKYRGTWQDLYAIDPHRAEKIDKNDQYRIDRALAIWHETGTKPSEYIPLFEPPGAFHLIFLTRDRQELRDRIAQRVDIMLEDGFVQEVDSLGHTWHTFLQQKKIIGYPEVIEYLQSDKTDTDYQRMKTAIVNKTTAYAKRQKTFWRMMERKIRNSAATKNSTSVVGDMEVINLTLSDLDLYIKQLSNKLLNSIKSRV